MRRRSNLVASYHPFRWAVKKTPDRIAFSRIDRFSDGAIMTVRIYHNPKCATSRRALAWLRENGQEPEVVEYLKTPPTRSELVELLKLLAIQPGDLLRKREPEFRKLRLDRPTVQQREILDAMVKHPRLIERPIVVKDNRRAIVPRPLEKLERFFR